MTDPGRTRETGGPNSSVSHRPSRDVEWEGGRRRSLRPRWDNLGDTEGVVTDKIDSLAADGRREEGGSRERRDKGGVSAVWTEHRRARTRHYSVEISDVVHRFVASSDDHLRVTAHGPTSYPPFSPHHTAQLLLERHGGRAVVHVAKELADCQAAGDGDGYFEWGEIADAIEDIQGASSAQGLMAGDRLGR